MRRLRVKACPSPPQPATVDLGKCLVVPDAFATPRLITTKPAWSVSAWHGMGGLRPAEQLTCYAV